MHDVGRVIGIGTASALVVCEGDFVVRNKMDGVGVGVAEGSDRGEGITMEAFGLVDKGKGSGDDVKGMVGGCCEGAMLEGHDRLVEAKPDGDGGSQVSLVGGKTRAMMEEHEVLHGEGNGHAHKGARDLIGRDCDVGWVGTLG